MHIGSFMAHFLLMDTSRRELCSKIRQCTLIEGVEVSLCGKSCHLLRHYEFSRSFKETVIAEIVLSFGLIHCGFQYA